MPGEGSLFDVPPAAIGRFRVLHQVGAGTSGPVFRAAHPETDDPLAIKLITLQLPPERASLVAEALETLVEVIGAVAGACTPIDAGLHGATPYVVTAFAAGDSLDVALKQYGPAVLADLVPRVRRLAAALDAAAARDVLHGALHPRDILVSDTTTELTGLGMWPVLARHGERFPIRRPYRAPELTDAAASAAGDRFSLAALTYEWMTGRRPPSAFVAGDMAPVPELDRDALGLVFARALHADPGVRFQSATDFVAELAAAGGVANDATAVGDVTSTASPTPGTPRRGDGRARRRSAPPPALPLEMFPAEAQVVEPAESAEAVEPEPLADGPVADDPHPDPDAIGPAAGVMLQVARSSSPADVVGLHDRADAPAFSGPTLQPQRPATGGARVVAGVAAGLVLGLAAGYLMWGRTSAPPATAPVTSTVAPAQVDAEAPAPSAPAAPPVDPAASGTRESAAVTTPPASPPPASAAPAPVAAATASDPVSAAGNLLVRSTPTGAAVFVDGRRRGVTPLTLQQVALGTRRVRLQRDGYTPEERQITLTSDRPSRSVEVRLTRAAPPLRTATPPASPAAAARTGSVLVETRPTGATVLLNGKAVGETPLTLSDLTPGDYTIRLQLAGHRPVTTTVRVVAGERQRAAASLERAQEPE